MLTPDDIKRLIDGGETAAVEFKLAKGGVPASLWESYSAFANTDGGVIVLGVGESDGKRHVVGVADAEKMVAGIWSTANNPQRISANVLFNRQVYTEVAASTHFPLSGTPCASGIVDPHRPKERRGVEVFDMNRIATITLLILFAAALLAVEPDVSPAFRFDARYAVSGVTVDLLPLE